MLQIISRGRVRRFTSVVGRKRVLLTASKTLPPKTLLGDEQVLPNGIFRDVRGTAELWYKVWLLSQFEKLPMHVCDIFHATHDKCINEQHHKLLLRACRKIADCTVSTDSITVDELVAHLYDEGLIRADLPTELFQYARYLVFCIIGWQSMLFTPSPLHERPSRPPQHLAIEEKHGCCAYTHTSLTQDISACGRESLSELLMEFGVLLPSKNLCLTDDSNLQRAFQEQLDVNPTVFNAYSMTSIAGIKIRWVDALSCHLEFNATAREVSLFRFPSFCRVSLLNYGPASHGVLHACATTSKLRCQWATEDEINQLLVEILLSYRLLFGQTKRSRTLFRSLDPFSGLTKNESDPLLSVLCGMRSAHSLHLGLGEKGLYHLPQDFPILRYRISVLQRNLSSTAPRTWLQLWRDNRNSANWLTFWAVIFFGAFGSFMAFLQVVLQFVQLFVHS